MLDHGRPLWLASKSQGSNSVSTVSDQKPSAPQKTRTATLPSPGLQVLLHIELVQLGAATKLLGGQDLPVDSGA